MFLIIFYITQCHVNILMISLSPKKNCPHLSLNSKAATAIIFQVLSFASYNGYSEEPVQT